MFTQNKWWDHTDSLTDIIDRNPMCIYDKDFIPHGGSSAEPVGCIYVDPTEINGGVIRYTMLCLNDEGWIYEADVTGIINGEEFDTVSIMIIMDSQVKNMYL